MANEIETYGVYDWEGTEVAIGLPNRRAAQRMAQRLADGANRVYTAECGHVVVTCEPRRLYDSDTKAKLSAEDLDVTPDVYAEAIRQSYAVDQVEGHIEVNGRTVFAE